MNKVTAGGGDLGLATTLCHYGARRRPRLAVVLRNEKWALAGQARRRPRLAVVLRNEKWALAGQAAVVLPFLQIPVSGD